MADKSNREHIQEINLGRMRIHPEVVLRSMGFPKDTMLHDIYVDPNTGYIILIVGHPDIPKGDGRAVTDIQPIFEKVFGVVSVKEWRKI